LVVEIARARFLYRKATISVERYFLIGALLVATVGAVKDVTRQRIPNRLTYSAILMALLLRGVTLGWLGLRAGALGVLLGGGLFYFLFLLGGMGGGDVKLMAAVGGWAGIAQTTYVLLVTAMAGGVIAIVYVATNRQVLKSISNSLELIRHHFTHGFQPHPVLNVHDADSLRIPYGLAIAIGTLYCVGTTFLRG